jgi:hypothetical protein
VCLEGGSELCRRVDSSGGPLLFRGVASLRDRHFREPLNPWLRYPHILFLTCYLHFWRLRNTSRGEVGAVVETSKAPLPGALLGKGNFPPSQITGLLNPSYLDSNPRASIALPLPNSARALGNQSYGEAPAGGSAVQGGREPTLPGREIPGSCE